MRYQIVFQSHRVYFGDPQYIVRRGHLVTVPDDVSVWTHIQYVHQHYPSLLTMRSGEVQWNIIPIRRHRP